MFKVTTGTTTFEIFPTEEGFSVDGQLIRPDVTHIEDGYLHILYNNKSFRAEVVKVSFEDKSFLIKVNGNLYPVTLKDKFDLLLEKMGLNNQTSGKVNNIKAPMPGLIVALKVAEGDVVKAGDPLIILEAMKMENIIKSPGEGIVRSVSVKKGDSVEKNQVLIEF